MDGKEEVLEDIPFCDDMEASSTDEINYWECMDEQQA